MLVYHTYKKPEFSDSIQLQKGMGKLETLIRQDIELK